MAALLDSAAVERQLLLPSARRPGLRITTAGLPPAPQERAKARVWASSASHRDARVDAVTPPLAGHTTEGAHLNTLGAVPLTLPPVPVWALAGTLR